jgi:tetratricopeptide (TPR) repeat protein
MPPPGNEYAAEQLKNAGNKCFKNGDYEEAEGLYSQAIQKNSNNPLLFTNRANARLKLEKWEGVIDDCLRSIELLKDNMKAFFYLGMRLSCLRITCIVYLHGRADSSKDNIMSVQLTHPSASSAQHQSPQRSSLKRPNGIRAMHHIRAANLQCRYHIRPCTQVQESQMGHP